MNYIKAPLLFKIKEVLRYIQICCLGIIYIKFNSQRHLAKTDVFSVDVWAKPRGGLVRGGNYE